MIKAEDKKIVYANHCQSFHIGCNNYNQKSDGSSFKDVKESHNDASKFEEFFKNELGYEYVIKMVDDTRLKQENLRSKLLGYIN